jgi:DNA repair protein RadD
MNVLSTGFNVPRVDLVAFLRPTKSPGLYVQQAGRGTRWAEGKENCLVLDFARNVQRLGFVDDPKVPATKRRGKGKKRGAGTEPSDLKSCPDCNNYTLASASYCSNCGHVFQREPPPPKHGARASDAPIMSAELTWLDVIDTSAKVHQKEGGFPSLRIFYRTPGGPTVSQFLAFEHPRGGYFARRAWRDLQGRRPEPETAAEALQRVRELHRPSSIGVRKEGKFYHVERIKHDHAADAA